MHSPLGTPLPDPSGGRERRRWRPFFHCLVLLIIVGAVLFTIFPASGIFSGVDEPANPLARLSLPGVAAAVPSGQDPVYASRIIAAVRSASQGPVYPEMATRVPDQTPAARIRALGILEEQPEPEVEATPEPAAPELPPVFTVYTVQPGDTVSSLATRFALEPESIIWNNVEINDEDFLDVGQQLRIPATDGIIHEVKLGDTLSDIAGRYNADLEVVEAFPSNKLSSPDDIHETQLVFVPGGEIPPPPPPPPPPAAADAAPVPAAGPVESVAAPLPSAGFIWPVSGPVSSYMDGSHPLGIDIDQYNNPGGAVAAAASGTVTFAGGDPCCSYGIYVVISHPDGFETLYAHLSSTTVVKGQTVSQGEIIGYVGCTGYCTGSHLHLEMYYNGSRVNPLSYLP